MANTLVSIQQSVNSSSMGEGERTSKDLSAMTGQYDTVKYMAMAIVELLVFLIFEH